MYDIERGVELLDLPTQDLARRVKTDDPRTKEALSVSFHVGQMEALMSKKREVLVCAGTQGGKTSFGPFWMLCEIALRGPKTYAAASPTFPLAETKMIPEYVRLFKDTLQIGEHRASRGPRLRLTLTGREWMRSFSGDLIASLGADPNLNPWLDFDHRSHVDILFGYASKPDSLESFTAAGAHLDECGQDAFRMGSYDAIKRRLSIAEGRILMTTTPYNLGWLKREVYDRWKSAPPLTTKVVRYRRTNLEPEIVWRRARHDHPWIDVINFESIMNPVFPLAEFEKRRAEMPRWKFDMFYRGLFTRPAGQIYDCLEERHFVPRFDVPHDWPAVLGVDFGGGVNTAAVVLRRRPGTRAYWATRTYRGGGRQAGVREHASAIARLFPRQFRGRVDLGRLMRGYGGARSEGAWRTEYRRVGLGLAAPPESDVEVGIDRVYNQILSGNLFFFDDLPYLADEMLTYSRVLNDRGEATAEVKNKGDFHLADGLRYGGQDFMRMRLGVPRRAKALPGVV